MRFRRLAGGAIMQAGPTANRRGPMPREHMWAPDMMDVWQASLRDRFDNALTGGGPC